MKEITARLNKISVESNNATELENTLFYPNRSAQNFAGSPYFPISFIKSSVSNMVGTASTIKISLAVAYDLLD
jgi:hypothetical protein